MVRLGAGCPYVFISRLIISPPSRSIVSRYLSSGLQAG